MRNNNYPSASLVIRNLSEITADYEVLDTLGRFRIIRFPAPFFDGSEFWIVNEKGFLWEPAESVEAALEYLVSDEATEYNSGV